MRTVETTLKKALPLALGLCAVPFAFAADTEFDGVSAFDKAYDPKTKTIHLNPDDPT